MQQLIRITFFTFVSFALSNCNPPVKNPSSLSLDRQGNSVKTVGGPCEGCDLLYLGLPEHVFHIDTSPAWNQSDGQKILLTGTVYRSDGETPAEGVVVYYYHTNTEGIYLHLPNEKRSMTPNALGQTHGYIRGWVKSNAEGKYSIYTIRPGSYPSRDEPEHIHLSVKEPDLANVYYIDDITFDDDPLLSPTKRMRMENRAGSGIVQWIQKDEIWLAERNIYLGLNIPDYPGH
ncbi:MAG: intradiol ring-cleavage dioxygenase [Saprospiraceae bacterium]|nr:intradiol ring-cleavage dioxygenase [Saprospiraceae bacterium]